MAGTVLVPFAELALPGLRSCCPGPVLPGAGAARLLPTLRIPAGKPSVLGRGTRRNWEGKTPSLNPNALLRQQSEDRGPAPCPPREPPCRQPTPPAAGPEQELPDGDGKLNSSIDDATADCCDPPRRFSSRAIGPIFANGSD